MWSRLRTFFTPPVFSDGEKTRRASLLNSIGVTQLSEISPQTRNAQSSRRFNAFLCVLRALCG